MIIRTDDRKSNMKKLMVVAIALSTLILQGCGTVIQMRGDAALFDMQNIETTLDTQPVKSAVYANVKSIVVADISDELGEYYPKDNKRLYRAAVAELELMLKESGKFKVLPKKSFRDKLAALNLEIDPTIDDDDELNKSYARVGKALNAHAVVSFGFEAPGATSLSNQAKYMGQLIIDGGITITMITSVDFVRSKTGEVLWSQRSKVGWATGTQGLATTKNRVLRKKLRVILKPLVDQAVKGA